MAVMVGLVMVVPTAAQEPTSEPYGNRICTLDLTEAYMSGWEYNHRDGAELDLVKAAQVARAFYRAVQPLQINCDYPNGAYKESVLRSLRGDYSPDELARMLAYLEEAVGTVEMTECAFTVAEAFVNRVDWGDTTALQVGRSVADIYRTVREVIPEGECDAIFKLVVNLLSQLDDIPPDGTLVAALYNTLSGVTEGRYFSEYACGYELADTFFDRVDWEGLNPTEIDQLVGDTFRISYRISEAKGCDEEPALAITLMLLNDVYEFPPDASIIQRTYDAASGIAVPVEAIPTATA